MSKNPPVRIAAWGVNPTKDQTPPRKTPLGPVIGCGLFVVLSCIGCFASGLFWMNDQAAKRELARQLTNMPTISTLDTLTPSITPTGTITPTVTPTPTNTLTDEESTGTAVMFITASATPTLTNTPTATITNTTQPIGLTPVSNRPPSTATPIVYVTVIHEP